VNVCYFFFFIKNYLIVNFVTCCLSFRYKGIGSLSNLQTATSDVIPPPSSKPISHHVIHNTYSFKNFNNLHDKSYELKKSSSTGTTNIKKYDTLDSSTSSNTNSKVHERRSKSVNLGIFDGLLHKKNHKNNNKKYFDRTLYL
jgi:hypothetical protein